jgi:hypothetical protein
MKAKKVNQKLLELGCRIGLDEVDIRRAKITISSMLGMAIAAGFVIIIGKFGLNQMDALGLYYTAVSVKDFGILNRFF